MFGVSLSIGPLVGGLLVGSVGWRAIFWINVPIGLAALVLTVVLVPESRAARPRPLDPVGQLLVAALIGGVTFAIIEAPRTGWLSVRVDVATAVALVAGAAFVPYELRRRQPMIELSYFRRTRFSGAIVIAAMSNGGFYSFLLLASLYLQRVLGHDPISAGLYLLPMGLMTAVFAPVSGSLIARTGPGRPLLVSGLLLSGGAALMLPAVARGSDALLLLSLTVMAAGFGFVNAPINYIAAAELPAEQAGLAAATTSTSRLVGGALGVAVVGSVLAARTSEHIADGFASASAPCWWIITGCGLVVLAISAATSVQRAGVRLRHAVAQRVVEADTASDQGA